MAEKIKKILDTEMRIYIEVPVIYKTYGKEEYDDLVKEVCTAYAIESGRIFYSLSNTDDVDSICYKIIEDFKKTIVIVFNNSTYASKETEKYLYEAVSTVQNHINEIAIDRNFMLY